SSGLGLPNDGHETEAVDVDTDLDDVRGEADVDSLLPVLAREVAGLELLDGLGDLVGATPGGELHRSVGPARIDAVAADQPGEVVGYVGLQERDGVAELAQRGEDVPVCPVRVAVGFGHRGCRLRRGGGPTGREG